MNQRTEAEDVAMIVNTIREGAARRVHERRLDRLILRLNQPGKDLDEKR